SSHSSSTRIRLPRPGSFFRRKIFLLDRGDDHVVGIDHLREMDFCNLRKQFIGVQFGEAVIGVHPMDELSYGDPQSVIGGPVNAAGTIELRASPFAGATPMHPRKGCKGKLTLKSESSA